MHPTNYDFQLALVANLHTHKITTWRKINNNNIMFGEASKKTTRTMRELKMEKLCIQWYDTVIRCKFRFVCTVINEPAKRAKSRTVVLLSPMLKPNPRLNATSTIYIWKVVTGQPKDGSLTQRRTRKLDFENKFG